MMGMVGKQWQAGPLPNPSPVYGGGVILSPLPQAGEGVGERERVNRGTYGHSG